MNMLKKFAITASLCGAVALAGHAFGQVVPTVSEPQPSATLQAEIDGFLADYAGTSVSVRGGNITRVYGKAFSSGASPIDSADAFVNAEAGIFGLTPANLLPMGPFNDGARIVPLVYDSASESYKFTLVTYSQFLNGIPVFRADLRVLVRNEEGFPAVLATSSLKDLGTFAETFNVGPISPSSIDTNKALRYIRNQFRQEPTVTGMEAVIWAGVDEQPEAPRLAYKFVAQGGLVFDPDNYQKWLCVVDAANGRILHQESLISHADVSGTVSGNATEGKGADFCGNESAVGLPYARVDFGATSAFADVNGNFVATGVAGGTTTGNSTLDGLYFLSNDAATSVEEVNAPIVGGVANFLHNSPNSDALVRAQVNAYVQANLIRDLVLAQNPSYPVISGQFGASAFVINTNIASTCNAFYDGVSINFYQSGGGCPNTAFSTVVHHEFGHHVVQSGGSGQGAYGEGMSDCMGILTTDDSVTGYGWAGDCNSGLRDAAIGCQYQTSGCSSCGSAIHSCGRLISGCVWDLRNEWQVLYPADYRDRLASIVINAVPLHGATSSINPDITIDYLTIDDDNADITDGTPNYQSINTAFTLHNMAAPPIQALKFTFPNGLPSVAKPDGTSTLSVNVTGIAGTPQPGTGKFLYRKGTTGAFTTVSMTETSANSYSVSLPSNACLGTIQFYVQATSTAGAVQSSPTNAPTSLYSVISAAGASTPFIDEMEISSDGWQAGIAGDTASSGIWERVDPNPTAAQPGDDHTANGTQCWVTGQGSPGGSLGENDIDGGVTTLVSPTFDATGFDGAYVSYWRWYSNNTGASPNADSMPVEISNNNGGTWVQLENVTENADAWVFKSFKISDFVTPTATMKLRWRASDLGSGSLVEAGVDDVSVTGFVCVAANPADINGDGVVDATDLALLLGSWGSAGAGDVNGDGTVDASDLALLLGAWG